MDVTTHINVDLAHPLPYQVVDAKQGDTGRKVECSIYDNGEVYNIPSGTYGAFRFAKPDGHYCFYDTENGQQAIEISGNTVTILLAAQVLTASGTGTAEVNLYNSLGERITGFAFTLDIEASVLPDPDISTDYVSFITALAQQVVHSGMRVSPLGYYQSLSALQTAVTNPQPGDVYGVGTSAPYNFYVYDVVSHSWINNGSLRSTQNITLNVKGTYATLAALQSAVPRPSAGDAYGVGASYPYNIYIYGTSWVNYGHIDGEMGAPGPNIINSGMSTNINGIVKGNGATISQAVKGTDYDRLTINTTTNINGILKGNGTNVQKAVQGVDYDLIEEGTRTTLVGIIAGDGVEIFTARPGYHYLEPPTVRPSLPASHTPLQSNSVYYNSTPITLSGTYYLNPPTDGGWARGVFKTGSSGATLQFEQQMLMFEGEVPPSPLPANTTYTFYVHDGGIWKFTRVYILD